MNKPLLFAFAALPICALAKGGSQAKVADSKAVVIRLSAPAYPAMAKLARITGTVNLNVTVSPTGSVDSVEVVNGHTLLKNAAVDSAKKSEFECKGCTRFVVLPLTYNFQLGDTLFCSAIDSRGNAQYEKYVPEIRQSEGSVTITDRPVAMCDPATRIVKVRSAKCLFLWRCSTRYPL
jgi:TonB family protein